MPVFSVSPAFALATYHHLYSSRSLFAGKSCCSKRKYDFKRPPCVRRKAIRVTLTGPNAGHSHRFAVGRSFEWNREELENFQNGFKGWSSKFLELCEAQLSLLRSSISNLAQVTLFFRHENVDTGALEFIPLIANSAEVNDQPARVWISFGAAGQTELENGHNARRLPGGIPAKWIFPDYPFAQVGEKGGILMPDGALCIPIEYNNILAGSLVLSPHAMPQASDDLWHAWSTEDISRADMVAKSIALAAALESESTGNKAMLGTTKSMIESIRILLSTTIHQVRSPISALVTFGHLLLRRLPMNDSNRETVKHMILEAMRVNDLLQPLDSAEKTLSLPVSVSEKLPMQHLPTLNVRTMKQAPAETIQHTPQPKLGGTWKNNFIAEKELVWLSDVLAPVADMQKVLAGQKAIDFVTRIDEDAPPVFCIEKLVREAVVNLLENSIKYCPAGSHVGLIIAPSNEKGDNKRIDSVDVIVWDTGPGFNEDELERVWEFGYRGSAAARTESKGSGIGLAVVKELSEACDAFLELVSPLPADLDPRDVELKQKMKNPGSAFTLRFKRFR